MAETQGFKDYLQRVIKAGRDAGYAAALEGAREIGGQMKTAVPRDSGKLAESIRLETNPRAARVTILAGGAKTATGRGDNALHQEFGTQRMPAHPFFFPAWRRGRKRARDRIAKATKKTIEETK